MTNTTIAIICIVLLLILVLSGIHIAFALSFMSFIGIWALTGKFQTAISILSTTSFEAIKDYTFAVIPLFVLMGCFMSRSGIAADLFKAANLILKKVPGGMAVATVISNAIFAAVTGVSVASASVFSRICLPEMDRCHYQKNFALGCVAGSSVLGMLIPPSVLMIVYGMLTETSIGKLFMAGFLPGIVLSIIYIIGISILVHRNPSIGGMTRNEKGKLVPIELPDDEKEETVKVMIGAIPTVLVVLLVLGGIWLGWFTPTEASAVGALACFILALVKGMRFRGVIDTLLESVGTTAAVLFLMTTAQMYSRMLAISGITTLIGGKIAASGLANWIVLVIILLILIALGCVLDSTSIILLSIPFILPIANAFGWNLLWFGIVMIVTVETGLLTPPFGMVVFSMKATINDDTVSVEDIFRGSFPFLIMMILAIIVFICFPIISTLLPSMM